MQKFNGWKYRFAVDVDDVLRSLLCNMVVLYNEEFGENLTCEDVDDYSVEKSFPKVVEKSGNATEWFFKLNAEKLFRESEPIEGAVEAINRLGKYGEVYIVTKQHGLLNKIYALEWLEKASIRYNAVCFVEDKSIIQCDYLIDDYHENFRDMKCGTGVIINAPYNEDVSDEYLREISECEEFRRFDSIADFVEFFEKECI
ncbi:MAG: hypothetical protein J6X18_12460 [Bacteroidales bacterium]|nr:hypothetical protein [Bacteroidales bacterium]